MSRIYAGALLVHAVCYLIGYVMVAEWQAHVLTVGRGAMLLGVWGLGYIALPFTPRLGWMLIVAGVLSSLLYLTAYGFEFVADVTTKADVARAAGFRETAFRVETLAFSFTFAFAAASGATTLPLATTWRFAGAAFTLAAVAVLFTFAGSFTDRLLWTGWGMVGHGVMLGLGTGISGMVLWRAGGSS